MWAIYSGLFNKEETIELSQITIELMDKALFLVNSEQRNHRTLLEKFLIGKTRRNILRKYRVYNIDYKGLLKLTPLELEYKLRYKIGGNKNEL